MLVVGFLYFRQWRLKNTTKEVIVQIKKESELALPIKAVKNLKKGKVDYYYLSSIKNADEFFVSNLPMSLYQKKEAKARLYVITPKLNQSSFKGVKRLDIQKRVYEPQLFDMKKVSEEVISTYHVKNDLTPFTLRDLLSGHLEQLQEQVSKQDSDSFLALDGHLIEKNGILTDGFRLENGNLLIGEKLSFPITEFFDVVNPDYLETADKVAYDDYLAKKKAAEEAKQNQKLVALTFDDGPDPKTTPQVLDLLAKYQAKATFFMMGSKIAGNEDLVKQISEAGHEIENHSWDHPVLTKLRPEEVQSQVNRTNQAILNACGKQPKYLRPPYGATNDSVRASSGLIQMLWTVDTRDWENHNTEGIMANVKKQLHPGGVVLMHDIHQTSVNALPTLLNYLKAQGYTCVTVEELFRS
ncbi:polysaccharide deacetylase [Streptococcus ictaluri 707-05]|uniref:Polysaccharide deacetylase n=1 Tax=Streptococcus ictaluri 707-05 TaxID=764299 RepID=G5K614_9STRE|nr:polysaccharide deacetylase [Streptococcus ictaluri 707-05]